MGWLRKGALAFALVAVPVMAQDEEDDGGGFLENLIERQLSGPGFEVRVRGFEGALSSRATIASLTISDEEGEWLTVTDAVLDWNRSALLRGRLEVEELSAASVSVPRTPIPDGDVDVPTPEATPFSLPDLPVSVQIERLALDRLELGEPLFGEAAVVTLTGSTMLDGGSGAADIRAERIDDALGVLALVGSYDSDDEALALDLSLEEGPDGIVASLIDLPDRPALAASVKGEGPLSDFTADIALATDGEPRLSGSVTLAETDGAQGFAVDLGGDIAPVFAPDYRPFFGPEIALQAEGARLPDGALRLDTFALKAQSLDLEGQVTIGADGVPDLIDVTGEISGDGGPVLLPVGGEVRVSRVDLDVQFDADAGETWTGEVAITDFDRPGIAISRLVLDGEGRIAGSGETLDVEAAFDFGAEGLTTASGGLQEALGDAVDGNAVISYEAGSPVLLDTFELSGAGFDLSGEGQVDPDGENVPVELSAALDAGDLTVFSALAGQPLQGGLSADLDLTATVRDGGFDLALDGSGQDLQVGVPQLDPLLEGGTVLGIRAERDGTGLRVPQFRLESEALEIDATADVSSERGDVEAAIRIDDLGRIDPDLSGPAEVTFTAINPGEAWDVDLRGSGAQAQVVADLTIGDLEAESPLAEGSATVTAEDLANFSVFAGRDLGGSADLAVEGSARLDLSAADVEVDGTLRDIRIDQPEADRLLRGATAIDGRVQREGSRLLIDGVRIDNPQITATADGRVETDDSLVTAEIEIADLSEVVPSMSGPASLNLQADEDENGWVIDLDGSGAGARIVSDATVTGIGGEASPLAEGTASVSVADLATFSELARRELAGSLDFEAEGRGRFDLSELSGALNGAMQAVQVGQPEIDNLLEGRTRIAASGSKDGERITVDELSMQNAQVGLTADGSYGTGESAIKAEVAFPDLGAVVPEMDGPGSVNLFAEEVGESWQVSLDGDGAGVMVSALGEVSEIESGTPLIDGTVNVKAADLARFRRIANRPLAGSLDAEADLRLRTDLSAFDVTLDATANALRSGISPVDRLLSGGRTTLGVAAVREERGGAIRVERFELDAPGLDASAEGSLLGGESDLTFDARLADLGQFIGELSGPVTARGRAGQAGSDFTLDVDATGPAGIEASVSGRVAENFARADLDIDGTAPLRLANPFIEPRSLSGPARFDLSLNGPLALASLAGQVTVSGGRFVDPSLPAVLNDIQATADLGGSRARISVTATKQEGGNLRVTGPIALGQGFQAELVAEIDDLIFEDPRLYRTEMDGQITVTGPLTGGATIAGQLELDDTELRIPSTGLGATGPIPDGLVHVNESADVRATRARADLIDDGNGDGGSGGGRAFPLDVTVLAPNRIFVRGRGLDAELGGQLRLGGTTANVVPSGQFDLIRGRLDLLGKRLILDEGRIVLQGDFAPMITLVARTDAGEVTVLIRVAGKALSPDISFLSEPELPEDEVLARLLFGRSIDEISPLQAAQLASAVATLAGKGGGGIVARLRQGTGLDDLDLTTDEDGNFGVRAGKYLSENLYTDVTVNAEGEAEINLNLDLTSSITVRGGATNSGETSLGVFYERDY